VNRTGIGATSRFESWAYSNGAEWPWRFQSEQNDMGCPWMYWEYESDSGSKDQTALAEACADRVASVASGRQ